LFCNTCAGVKRGRIGRREGDARLVPAPDRFVHCSLTHGDDEREKDGTMGQEMTYGVCQTCMDECMKQRQVHLTEREREREKKKRVGGWEGMAR